MCGICGKIYFDPSRAVDPGLIRRMTDVLGHRGPDDSGIFTAGGAGLGHRRLSIIDLSAAGRQPMENEDGTLRIVFNGEIYNYRELRPGLEARGHRFVSQTDTEVVLHLFEELGAGCVEHLRGMFALAIWNSRTRELFLARDRAGKKPLSYAVVDGSLIFASELKSLILDPALRPEVDPVAVHEYLTYQYVPGPRTIYAGVCKLPPAHTLTMRDGRVTISRYWRLSYQNQLRLPRTEDYCERLREVFTEAVKIRLRSDVPLGAFLSGGVDSSATVAVMAGLLDRPVKTFSIGFDEKDFNELEYAGDVARRFGNCCRHERTRLAGRQEFDPQAVLTRRRCAKGWRPAARFNLQQAMRPLGLWADEQLQQQEPGVGALQRADGDLPVFAFQPAQLGRDGEDVLVLGAWVIAQAQGEVGNPGVFQRAQLALEGRPDAAGVFDVQDGALAGRSEQVEKVLIPVVANAQSRNANVRVGRRSGGQQAGIRVAIGVPIGEEEQMIDLPVRIDAPNLVEAGRQTLVDLCSPAGLQPLQHGA